MEYSVRKYHAAHTLTLQTFLTMGTLVLFQFKAKHEYIIAFIRHENNCASSEGASKVHFVALGVGVAQHEDNI